MTGATAAYERQPAKELNALLAEAKPENASPEDAERVVLLAVMRHN
jgi:hypothetical protein